MLLSPGTETGATVPTEVGSESHLALELPRREPWDLSRSLEKEIGRGCLSLVELNGCQSRLGEEWLQHSVCPPPCPLLPS